MDMQIFLRRADCARSNKREKKQKKNRKMASRKHDKRADIERIGDILRVAWPQPDPAAQVP